MTTISGDNVTISGSDFISYKGQVLKRNGLTSNSTDLTPTAAQLTADMSAPYTAEYSIQIYNSSLEHKIELTCNTGCTMIPGPSDTIMPGSIKRYDIKIIDQNTFQIFNLDHNGQAIKAERILTNVIEREVVNQPVIIYQESDTDITLGGEPPANLCVNGAFLSSGNVYKFQSVAYLDTNSGMTYSSGQILGGFIKRDLDTSGSTTIDYLPNATDIVSAIPNAKLGTSFACYIQNASNSNKNLRIYGNDGTTISGLDTTFPRRQTICFLFVIADTTQGSEAVTAYVLGTLRDARGGTADLITTVTSDSYTVLESDNTINVDYAGSGHWWVEDCATITLPEISSVGQKRYFITDVGGHASDVNIIVTPSGSDTIVGENSFTINSDYSSISMYNDESSNWILY